MRLIVPGAGLHLLSLIKSKAVFLCSVLLFFSVFLIVIQGIKLFDGKRLCATTVKKVVLTLLRKLITSSCHVVMRCNEAIYIHI